MNDPFSFHLEEEDLKRERAKARELRRSQWWKRRLSCGRCYYCQRLVAPGKLTMDHVVPMSRGGRSVKNNVVPACKYCNSMKKQLLPMEWDAHLARMASGRDDYGID